MSVAITAAETLPPKTKVEAGSLDLTGTPREPDVEVEAAKASCELTQCSVSVTLDGPTLVLATLCIVLLIHFLDAPLAEALLALVPIVLLVRNDYHNFLRLGPGGTPATVHGYLRITWFRLWTLRDPFTAPLLDPARQLPPAGLLRRGSLPYRAGPRPVVAGIAPQRQLDQHGARRCYRALRRAMSRLGDKIPGKFGTERSCLEKHGLALFARHPLQTNCQGEICHVHDSDHSMHMCLHPDDMKEVLAKGWGQRHPLAWRGRFLKSPVSQDFVMIYAPRDDQELEVVCKIIEAAIWYTLAEDVVLGDYLKPF